MKKIVVRLVLVICFIVVIGFFGACTVEVVENIAPVADAGTNQTLYVNETVQFDGSSSSDDGSIVSYYWDFGDTFTADIIDPTHSYSVAGDYDVTLTVTDNDGATDDSTIVITIENLHVGTWEWLDGTAPLDLAEETLYSFKFVDSNSFELSVYGWDGSEVFKVWAVKGTTSYNDSVLNAIVTEIWRNARIWPGLETWVTSGTDWDAVLLLVMNNVTTFNITYSIVADTMTIDVGAWLTWGSWTSGSRDFTKI